MSGHLYAVPKNNKVQPKMGADEICFLFGPEDPWQRSFPNHQERKRHINKNKFSGDCPGRGGVSRPGGEGLPNGGQGSKVFMCCVRNPRNINVFVRVPGREESGSQPGGSVTGVAEKLFMCQMFMCLFRPLNQGRRGDPNPNHSCTV